MVIISLGNLEIYSYSRVQYYRHFAKPKRSRAASTWHKLQLQFHSSPNFSAKQCNQASDCLFKTCLTKDCLTVSHLKGDFVVKVHESLEGPFKSLQYFKINELFIAPISDTTFEEF